MDPIKYEPAQRFTYTQGSLAKEMRRLDEAIAVIQQLVERVNLLTAQLDNKTASRNQTKKED